NLVPFDDDAVRTYGISWMRLKFRILRVVQGATFRSASGVIFLTASARDWVTRVTARLGTRTEVIPPGISSRFSRHPAPQLPITEYSAARPVRLLYVSHLQPYKHYAHLISAVRTLPKQEYPVAPDLLGRGSRPAEQGRKSTVGAAGGRSAGTAY